MLTQSQLNEFNSQGYLVVENLIDADSLAAIRAEYAALMDRQYAQWTSHVRQY